MFLVLSVVVLGYGWKRLDFDILSCVCVSLVVMISYVKFSQLMLFVVMPCWCNVVLMFPYFSTFRLFRFCVLLNLLHVAFAY